MGPKQSKEKSCSEEEVLNEGQQGQSMIVRMPLRDLDKPENARKKNDFLKAWKLMKELPPTNPNSFWSIASYHGMPYKNRRVDPLHPDQEMLVWDGYCQHANVLFPTWHRFFCLRIEQALQTVVPSGDVALHYWDETSTESLQYGLPDILTQPTVTIDGVTVPNPLTSFTIPRPTAEPGGNDLIYLKPAGYTTVRYPYSGIQYPPAAKAVADAHNKTVANPTQLLQQNCHVWLNFRRVINPPGPNTNSIFSEFKDCLNVPNYNVFSNTTSATGSSATYQALEQPHNDIHLMVGGYTTPMMNDDGSVKVDDADEPMYAGLMKGANGDMGENETAAFDPVFFFHHCNIDRMFWVWQKKWHHTDEITINPLDPTRGNTNIGQGPTPNQTPGQALTTDTILYPFHNELGVPRVSTECVNIETQLGYTYAIGSLDQAHWPSPSIKEHNVVSLAGTNWEEVENNLVKSISTEEGIKTKAFVNRTQINDPILAIPLFAEGDDGLVELGGAKWKVNNHVKVSNIDKGSISGSFVVYAYYKKAGKLYHIGQRAVLDRWDRTRCENCQKHPKAAVGFSVDHCIGNITDMNTVEIHLVSRDAQTGGIKTVKMNYTPKPEEKDARFDLITSFEQAS